MCGIRLNLSKLINTDTSINTTWVMNFQPVFKHDKLNGHSFWMNTIISVCQSIDNYMNLIICNKFSEILHTSVKSSNSCRLSDASHGFSLHNMLPLVLLCFPYSSPLAKLDIEDPSSAAHAIQLALFSSHFWKFGEMPDMLTHRNLRCWYYSMILFVVCQSKFY